jgi:hypothetical protein
LLVAGACTNDPVYLPGEMMLEAGVGGMVSEATASLQVPINLETPDDATARAVRTVELGVDVPYVKLGDIEISVEWTIKSLDPDMEGTARVQLNGASETFAYDPSGLQLTDDPDIEAPGLDGDIPIHVPALGSVSGTFREDSLREASVDLEQITRGNYNPFTAMLTFSKNTPMIQPVDDNGDPDPNAIAIPREAFAQIVRIDIRFRADRHMVLEYTVRVRDVRGGMIPDELTAAPPEELATFSPATYGG